MTRTTTTKAPPPPDDVEDDEYYRGVLISAKKVKSTNPQYPDDQIEVVWEGRQGWKPKDWIAIRLGVNASTGSPSRLRQLLNAAAEKPKDTELWFDAETLEWGYDLDGDDSTPAFAKLEPGKIVIMFKGDVRDGKAGKIYKFTGYKQAKK